LAAGLALVAPGAARSGAARSGTALRNPHQAHKGNIRRPGALSDIPTSRQDVMSAKAREIAESAFEKTQRREAEINAALRQDQARHEAALKNMERLRSLRLQRDAQGL